jgi:hypothetical protein
MVVGDVEEADAHFEVAARQCRELAAIPHLARTHHDWATVKAALGDDASAMRLEARARELAERVGMVLGDLTAPAAAAR